MTFPVVVYLPGNAIGVALHSERIKKEGAHTGLLRLVNGDWLRFPTINSIPLISLKVNSDKTKFLSASKLRESECHFHRCRCCPGWLQTVGGGKIENCTDSARITVLYEIYLPIICVQKCYSRRVWGQRPGRARKPLCFLANRWRLPRAVCRAPKNARCVHAFSAKAFPRV